MACVAGYYSLSQPQTYPTDGDWVTEAGNALIRQCEFLGLPDRVLGASHVTEGLFEPGLEEIAITQRITANLPLAAQVQPLPQMAIRFIQLVPFPQQVAQPKMNVRGPGHRLSTLLSGFNGKLKALTVSFVRLAQLALQFVELGNCPIG
jgi:hypothetical protein